MKGQFFLSFDGPKATGKTTVLESVAEVLRVRGQQPVVSLCEKEVDPYRHEILDLIKELVVRPGSTLERRICERLADGRAWISANVLNQQPVDAIILIDRWYPSDAAFRKITPFSEILKLNIDRKVRVPDLHVGVLASPDISWSRAECRPRGLSSVVIRNFQEHVDCSAAFERAIVQQGWFVCRNEGSVEASTKIVTDTITAALRENS